MGRPSSLLGRFGRSVASLRAANQPVTLHRSFSSTASYDVAVIGGGPGGYVAAIKASQLGLKTVCIEKRGTLGGTCLNVGCIPSKALLNISHKFHDAEHNFAKMGINFGGKCSVDVGVMQQQKAKSVKGLTSGIEMLFKANRVTYEKASASFVDPKTLQLNSIESSGVPKTLTAKHIIIATGSESAPLPGGGLKIDEVDIITSTGALELQSIPKRLVVIGGGVIGLEMGSVWRRLGTEVVVVEFLDRIVPGIDGEVAKAFQASLEKQGFKFNVSTKVTGVTQKAPGSLLVHVQDVTSGSSSDIECDKVLVAVGRHPFTAGLNLEAVGVETDKGGRIVVDEHLKVPSQPHIYAIGDVVQGPMLAHKAEEEGIAVVEHIAGQGGHVNYNAIPSVVYTHPEVAGVGSTEEKLKADGVSYRRGFFPFGANSRARTNDDFEGFVKVLTDEKSDRILGAWIIGPDAGELIQQLVLGMEYGASSEDIARTCHAHPTLSEAVKEACMSAFNKPIHNVQK